MSDLDIRLAAFDWLAEQTEIHQDVLPSQLLRSGFMFRGDRVFVVAQRGIFTPRQADLPLTIRHTTDGPYNDYFGTDNLLRYSYQGKDPNDPANEGLRELMRLRRPLIYLHRILTSPARYVAGWPCFIVADEPRALRVRVAVDDSSSWFAQPSRGAETRVAHLHEDAIMPAPRYTTSLFRRRLHQRAFRERVLDAYQSQCAFCRLRKAPLLDAAHIRPDAEGGEPVISNGIALCKLHHAAFDRHFVAVEPSTYRILVQPHILDESDGPMLRHGLQDLHGQRIHLPRRDKRPDPEHLTRRLELFENAVTL